MYNYSAELLNGEDSSFCCRDGKIAVEPLPSLPSGWTEMFMDTNFRYDSYCLIMCMIFNYMIFYIQKSQSEVQQFVLIYSDESLWTGRICLNGRPKLHEDQWQNVPPCATWKHERNCKVVCS